MCRRYVKNPPAKTCTNCGGEFRRRSGLANVVWSRQRFCSVPCVREWQRGDGAEEQRKSGTGIGFCLACEGTFNAIRGQKYCRRNECQSARLRERLGFTDAELFDTPEHRQRELERLVSEQEVDLRFGDRPDKRHFSLDAEVGDGEGTTFGDFLADSDRPFVANIPGRGRGKAKRGPGRHKRT